MKNKYVNIILCLCLLTSTLSCKKYLDIKSDDTLVSPVTIDDAQALLDNSRELNQQSTGSFGEASADDYFLTEDSYNSVLSDDEKIYTWIPFDYYHPNDWSECYSAVYISNLALETINKIPITNSNSVKWDNIKGSALFYRSFYFLQLAWTFSKAYDPISSNEDLGIVLRLTSDLNKPSVRANVKDSYTQIINDAKEAIQYLPNIPAHEFRPSKPACYGLLARAYLSMNMFDSAFKYSNLCLQLKSNLIDLNNFNSDDFDNPSSSFPFKRFNSETIFYTETNGTLPSNLITTPTAKIDSFLYASYIDNDLRKAAFFAPVDGYQIFKGSYAGNRRLFFSGIATDEMWLIRSECYARGINGNAGDKDAAIDDLNHLLITRWNNSVPWIPYTATDAADALNQVLLERRKELVYRGLRWIEIKRLNKLGYNIIPKRLIAGQTYTLLPNANYYALPIPKDIIIQSGISQNPQ